MVVETALFVGGVIGTLVLGAPVVVALASPHRWRSVPAPDLGQGRDRDTHHAAFTPLDLGPDPVLWPSQRPERQDTGSSLGTPRWPSQTWDDEHFGSHWREGRTIEIADPGFRAMANRNADMVSNAETPRPAPRKPSPAMGGEAHQRQRANAQRARQQQSAAADEARKRQRKVAVEQFRQEQAESGKALTPRRAVARPKVPVPVKQTQPTSQLEAPSRQELEALIAKVGLAGTVQAIMDRTGWDFRQAAHHLAKIRQGK